MSLLKRFVYYFGGLALGIMLLYFFIGGSGSSCEYNYWPDARVLKNIRIKKRVFAKGTIEKLSKLSLDTAAISYILKKGDVNFSKSDIQNEKCNIYTITGTVSKTSEKELQLVVENCSAKATIQSIEEITD